MTKRPNTDDNAPIHLPANERERLQQLEEVVERGIDSFIELGCALEEIRGKKLYRETHLDFEVYCKQRWDQKKALINPMIKATAVVMKIVPRKPVGSMLPENFNQAGDGKASYEHMSPEALEELPPADFREAIQQFRQKELLELKEGERQKVARQLEKADSLMRNGRELLDRLKSGYNSEKAWLFRTEAAKYLGRNPSNVGRRAKSGKLLSKGRRLSYRIHALPVAIECTEKARKILFALQGQDAEVKAREASEQLDEARKMTKSKAMRDLVFAHQGE